jgi:hypothetical protein
MSYLLLLTVIIAALATLWFFVRRQTVRLKAKGAELANASAKAGELEARRQRYLTEWLPLLEGLPVLERIRAPRLHSPVYDCISEQFELPCAHLSYAEYTPKTLVDMVFGQLSGEQVQELLAEASGRSPDTVAFVRAGDTVYLLDGSNPHALGSKVQCFVRIGPDVFVAYGWRSGLRAHIGALDPPYCVAEISANPELWAKRLAAQQEAWNENTDYQTVRRRCFHRDIVAA